MSRIVISKDNRLASLSKEQSYIHYNRLATFASIHPVRFMQQGKAALGLASTPVGAQSTDSSQAAQLVKNCLL